MQIDVCGHVDGFNYSDLMQLHVRGNNNNNNNNNNYKSRLSCT